MYNERELAHQIAEGDETAFEELFYHYSSKLRSHLFSLLKSATVVEDVLQETFLSVWLNRDKLPEIQNIGAWIYRIASNSCYNHLRRNIREEKKITVLERKDFEDIREQLDFNEVNRIIQEAISLLSPQRKKIWNLQRNRGMKQAEIAEHLQLSLSTVKNTMTQSLEFIRQHLKKKGYTLPLVLVTFLLKYFSS